MTRFLDDADRVRVWVPEEDDPRWDDTEDHGDPKIERWARTLAELGPEVAIAAAIACAQAIAIVWDIDVKTPAVRDAISAARSRQQMDVALAHLASDESQIRWAHQRDAWRAARCALVAAMQPEHAGSEAAHAALFAYRVMGWASHGDDEWHRAVNDLVARYRAEGTDDADRLRQTLRLIVRATLLDNQFLVEK